MNDPSLILLYNFAPHYRTAIFKLIEKSWNCKWIFGDNKTDIQGMDLSQLKNVSIIQNKQILGNFYWQKGSICLTRSKKANLLMLGEIYNLSSWVILLFNKLKRKNQKIYLWSHGWYGRESIIKKYLKKIYFKLADGIFLYGNYAKTIAISQGFSQAETLYVIHNSLDYEKQLILRNTVKSSNLYSIHFNNSYKNIIFIGRLTKSKKLNLLIESLKLLELKNKHFNLTIIGDGEDKKNLENLTNSLKLKSKVWFYGPCYNEKENADLLFNADLCVSPGNVGLTAIHSLMFGTPIITHDSFPFQGPEFEAITPGLTGDFFKKDDIKDLANKIESWFRDYKNKREKIRIACFNEIDNYWNPRFQLSVLKDVIK